MRRGEVHPEVRDIIEAVMRDVVLALRRDGRLDLAVVVDAGREDLRLHAAVERVDGIRWTIMPRADALDFGREHTLEAGELLAEELPPGEAWCLVVGAQGGAAVPIVMRRARGAAS